MSRVYLAAAAAVVLMTVLPAAAQDTPNGEYAEALRRMIVETAGGRCPEDIMAGPLLEACRQQVAQMSAGLTSLGAIESMTFVRVEETPNGRVEVYSVRFASGQTLNWGIGGAAEGKFSVAYAGGA